MMETMKEIIQAAIKALEEQQSNEDILHWVPTHLQQYLDNRLPRPHQGMDPSDKASLACTLLPVPRFAFSATTLYNEVVTVAFWEWHGGCSASSHSG